MKLWAKSTGKSFIFSPYNKAKFLDFLSSIIGEEFLLEIIKKPRPKSEQILGYWWGAILPVYIAHNKGLQVKIEALDELLKTKVITPQEIEDAHNTLLTEFSPLWVDDIKGKPTKQRGEMKKMNNPQVMELITDVLNWFADNGYPIPDPEEYKAVKNSALFKNRERSGELEYPSENYEPNF